jgi:hypothetical protein
MLVSIFLISNHFVYKNTIRKLLTLSYSLILSLTLSYSLILSHLILSPLILSLVYTHNKHAYAHVKLLKKRRKKRDWKEKPLKTPKNNSHSAVMNTNPDLILHISTTRFNRDRTFHSCIKQSFIYLFLFCTMKMATIVSGVKQETGLLIR